MSTANTVTISIEEYLELLIRASREYTVVDNIYILSPYEGTLVHLEPIGKLWKVYRWKDWKTTYEHSVNQNKISQEKRRETFYLRDCIAHVSKKLSEKMGLPSELADNLAKVSVDTYLKTKSSPLMNQFNITLPLYDPAKYLPES